MTDPFENLFRVLVESRYQPPDGRGSSLDRWGRGCNMPSGAPA
jgi:hypothetical protein